MDSSTIWKFTSTYSFKVSQDTYTDCSFRFYLKWYSKGP